MKEREREENNKMRVDLLMALAEFLERPEISVPGKFDLTTWMTDYERLAEKTKGSPEHKNHLRQRAAKASGPAFSVMKLAEPSDREWATPIECQTVGCAIGWAATLPIFQEAGLRLIPFHHRFDNVEFIDSVIPGYVRPKDGLLVSTGNTVPLHLFEISNRDSEWLFYPVAYPEKDRSNPKAVAARIRQFVEYGERPL